MYIFTLCSYDCFHFDMLSFELNESYVQQPQNINEKQSGMEYKWTIVIIK